MKYNSNMRIAIVLFNFVVLLVSYSSNQDDPFHDELRKIRLLKVDDNISIETIINKAEDLVQKYPDHPRRAELMFYLSSLYQSNSVPELSKIKDKHDSKMILQLYENAKISGQIAYSQKMSSYWASQAMNASEIGTELWLFSFIRTPYDLNLLLENEKAVNALLRGKNPFVLAYLDHLIIDALLNSGNGMEALERYKQLMRRHQEIFFNRQQVSEKYDLRQMSQAQSRERSTTDEIVRSVMGDRGIISPFDKFSLLEKFTLLTELGNEFNNIGRLGMQVGIAQEKLQSQTKDYLYRQYQDQKKAAQVIDQPAKKPVVRTAYVPDNSIDIVVTRDAENLRQTVQQRRGDVVAATGAVGASQPAAPERNYSYYYILAGLLLFGAIACGYSLKLKMKN